MTRFIEAELGILDMLQVCLSHDWLNPFWIFISYIGNAGVLWIVLSVILVIYPKTRTVGLMCIVSLILSGLVTNLILKNIFARPRPFTYNDFQILIKAPWDHSFPSGHTSAAFAFAFVVQKETLMIGRYKVYRGILVIAFLMSLSRLALYLHFPSDVITSVAAAYCFAWLAIKLVSKWQASKGAGLKS